MKSLFSAPQYHRLTAPLELAKLEQLQIPQPVTDYLYSVYYNLRLKKHLSSLIILLFHILKNARK